MDNCAEDTNNSNEQTPEEIAGNSLMQDVPLVTNAQGKTATNDLKLENKIGTKNPDNLIKNINDKVLFERLSPEITDNEKAKRHHKYILLILLTLFLILQFASVRSMSNKVLAYAISGNPDKEILKNLLTFVTGYITSVVIELIAILKYIVKRVFDTSITDLIKIFRDYKENSDSKEQEK